MTDDEIRLLLRVLGTVTAETPSGFVRVSAPEVARHADLPAVSVWIANQGGLVDHADGGAGEESFLVPERALDGD